MVPEQDFSDAREVPKRDKHRNKINVLLLDDVTSSLSELKHDIADMVDIVEYARQGPQVFEKINAADFAVILVGLQMPSNDGLKLARQIRSHPLSARTPILFLNTMKPGEFPLAEAYAIDAVDHLAMPADVAVLKARLAFFIELYCARQEAAAADRGRHASTLDEKDERIRLILENTSDYAFIVTDLTGRITEWEGGAEAITGWAAAEVIGESADIIFTPEDRRAGRPQLEMNRAKETGRAEDRRWHLRKDGSRFFANGVLISLEDAGGELHGYAKIFRDMSNEQRQAEELRKSEERYRTLFDVMDEGFCIIEMIFDPEGRPFDYRFLEINPAFERHTGLVNAVNKTAREMVPTLDPFWFETYGRVALSGQPVRFINEAPAMGKWFDVQASRMGGAESRKVALLFNDISERRQLELQRERLFSEVQAASQRMEEVFQQAPAFMCILRGPEHIFELTNERYLKLIGGRRNIVGKPAREVLPEVDGQGFFELLDEVYRTGKLYVGNDVRIFVQLQADAPLEERHIDFVYQPLRDADGLVNGILVHGVDQTERKRAEIAIRDAERRLRFVMDSMQQKIFTTTPLGEADYFNPAWTEFTGLDPDEILHWEWKKIIHPDDLEENLEAWRHSLQTEDMFQFEHRLRDVYGQYRWHLCRAVPLRDEAGKLVLWIGSDTDIHDVKQAEADVTQRLMAEERTSSLLEKVAAASRTINSVLSVHSITGILAESARSIVGAHQAAVSLSVGDHWEQAINAVSLSDKYDQYRGYDAKTDGSGIYAEVCRTNKSLRLTQREVEQHPAWRGFGKHADRHPPMHGWLAVPLIGFGGKNLGVVELTDRFEGEFTEEDEAILTQLAAIASVRLENARLYDSLREQDQRKDEFLAILAHELRNPLAPLRTGLDILKINGDEQRSKKVRSMMERQLSHMVRLVDDLMDVSRVSRGKVDLKQERLSLRAVLEVALETSRPLFDASRHRLVIGTIEDALCVNGDLTRLAQVVSNLLNNAAKYTPAGGRIEISAYHDKEQVVLKVSDNGIGISQEMLPKVFDLFTQIGTSIDRAQGGLGIGLSLAKKLVEMHGGTIQAESKGEGAGSSFTVRLPAAKTLALHTQADPDADGDALQPGNRKRILVVDDNVDAAETLGMLLDFEGHLVKLVHTGTEAVEEAGRFRPDLVFLDIGLPGMSGYEVAAMLRRQAESKETVLVALTGWGSEEDRRNTRAAGFDFHLTKPISSAMISSVLQRFLGGDSPLL